MADSNIYLDVQNLHKSIGDLILLDNVSFSVAEGEHIGLIARNGAGKSTLINILKGLEEYDSGQVVYRNDLRIGILDQSPVFPPTLSVLEACLGAGNEQTEIIKRYEQCVASGNHDQLNALINEMDRLQAWDYEQRIKQILSKFNITNLEQPISQLSGGQLKRVALANVLVTEPDFLILDEPTNHLDLEMIEWLEEYLRRSTKSLLMVTHDRYFLDRVCTEIIEIDNQQIYSYRGNYAYYLEKRQERIDATNAMLARSNNLYRRELEWMRSTPSARSSKARYREEAFADLEKIVKQKREQARTRLQVKGEYLGSKIFEAEYISKAFDNKVILKDFVYTFSRYEKMGIVGANGTGKSTFIKMLLGQVKPDSGKFVVGDTVKFGYFSQDGLDFNEQDKVIDIVRQYAETIDVGGKRITASQFLTHFMFPPEVQQNYVYKLSGGERRRLYLCTILLQNPNFLILDEPTNDLDIITLQVLEEFLSDFKGCVIVVSHDRYFLDKVVDHLLVFRGDGTVQDFPGNYTQYRHWEKLQNELQAKDEQAISKESKKQIYRDERKANAPRKMTFKEKHEFEQLEVDIEALEGERSLLQEALSSGVLDVDDIATKAKRLSEVESRLDEKTMRWLELSELI